MHRLTQFLKHPTFTWGILSLPALPMLIAVATSENPRIYHILVHPSGEFSARLLILCLAITPLVYLFKEAAWPRWLQKRRRYIGVAAAGYAALHVIFYLIDKGTLSRAFAELTRSYIWLGWLAFAVFVPLTVTSTDRMVKRLGRNWKRLQQTVYAAAVLTVLHWAALHDWSGWGPALANFAPLILLALYRVYYVAQRNRRRTAIAA